MRSGRLNCALVVLLLLFSCATVGAEWLETGTRHITIIYERDDAAVAAELAGFADEVYEELAPVFGIGPRRPIPVLIRGNTADAGGYFTVLPVSIVIYAATPSTPIAHPNLDEWLRIVFVHELVHYFQFTDPAARGVLPALLGPGAHALDLLLFPRWFAEGSAIVAETALSEGGRGRSPVFEMQYLAAVLADDYWSFYQNLYGSDFAPRTRPYVGGYVLVDYIARTYGIDAVVAIGRETLNHPIAGIRRAILRVLGVDAEDLYASLRADLDAAAAPRVALGSGDRVSPAGHGYWFLVRGSDAIYGSSVDSYSRYLPAGAWSDGFVTREMRKSLHFVADPYSVSVAGGMLIGIRPVRDTLRPDPFLGYTDLFAVDLASGRERRVTHGRRLYHSYLLPDGSAAVAALRAGAYSRLVTVDLATGSVAVIWEPPRTYMSGPVVSPDGTRVAVAASVNGEQDLYEVSLADGTARQLTASAGVAEYFPVYVDAATLWFTANLDGPLALYELSLETGSVVRRLTDETGIFYATPRGDGAVYAAYSVTGPSVKLATSLEATAVPWPGGVTGADRAAAESTAPLPEPESTAWPEAAAQPRRHIDWPIPTVWLPFVLPARSEGGFALEAGALGYGVSVREKNLVSAQGSVHTQTLVPTLALEWAHLAGATQFTLRGDSAPLYLGDEGLDSQLRLALVAGAERPLFTRDRLRRTQTLAGSFSAGLIATSAPGVTFADHREGPFEQTAAGAGALVFASSRERRRTDLFGPAGTTAGVTAGQLVDLGAAASGGWLDAATSYATANVAVRLPVARAMADVSLSGATASYPGRIDAPRGNSLKVSGPDLPATTPVLVARIGVDSPAHLTDRAFRGINLTRLGASGYVQQAVDLDGGTLTTRPEILLGVEFAARLGALEATFMPTVGLAASVPYADPGSFTLFLTVRNAEPLPGVTIGTMPR
jgi:hypothetical protein